MRDVHELEQAAAGRKRRDGLRVILLVVVSALAGCGDDAPEETDSGSGPGPTSRCRDDVLERRQDGVWVEEHDCAQDGEVCREGDAGTPACVAAPCLTGEKDCDGEVLVRCVDGDWQVEQDCAALDQHCVPLLGGLPLCSDEPL